MHFCYFPEALICCVDSQNNTNKHVDHAVIALLSLPLPSETVSGMLTPDIICCSAVFYAWNHSKGSSPQNDK